jgi:hypothetical protein
MRIAKDILLVLTATPILASSLAWGWASEPGQTQPKYTRHFLVQGKFIEIIEDELDKTQNVTRIPSFRLLEGHPSQFTSGGSLALAGPLAGPGKGTPYGLSLNLKILVVAENKVQLELAVKHSSLSMDNRSANERTASLQTVLHTKLGTPLKMVLEEDSRNTARRWLEITVGAAD